MKHWTATWLAGTVLACATLASASAAEGTSIVYRCPGNPVLYTDQLTAKQAQEKGCRTIENAPITVMQSPKPRPGAANGSRPEGRIVPSTEQRARDDERRTILQGELRREEDKLADLKKEYNNGEPERLGSERNYQKYLDRVAELKAGIARKEADIEAIKREIAKLPPQ